MKLNLKEYEKENDLMNQKKPIHLMKMKKNMNMQIKKLNLKQTQMKRHKYY